MNVQAECFVPYLPAVNPGQVMNDVIHAWLSAASAMYSTMSVFFGGTHK